MKKTIDRDEHGYFRCPVTGYMCNAMFKKNVKACKSCKRLIRYEKKQKNEKNNRVNR